MEKPSLFRRLRRALWFATAGGVILVAVLLTLTRLLLPGLEGYRGQVEALASAALGQPVRITTLSSRLHGLSPLVVLEGVELLDAAAQMPVARLGEVAIGIDVLASLRRMQPVMASLAVSGAELTVVRQADGRIAVQGVVGQGEAAAGTSGIGRWLLAQERLALQESRLHWDDRKSGHRLDFERVEITLHNRDERHQLNVDIALPPGAGRDLRLHLDLEGNILQPGAWAGRGHIQGRGLRPLPWLEEWGPLAGISLHQGVFDFQMWGEWEAGRLVRIDGEVGAQQLRLAAAGGGVELAAVGGGVQWQRDAEGWELRLHDLRLTQRQDERTEPAQLRVRRNGGWDVQLTALRLEDIATLVPLVPGVDEEMRAALHALQPRGRLRELRLVLAGDGRPAHVQGAVEQGVLAPWQRLPGVSGLQAEWVWDGSNGRVLLDSHDGMLTLPRLFRAPLSLQQLQGEIGLSRDGDGWRVAVNGMRVANADIHAAVDAVINLPRHDAPYLDLRGVFWNGRAVATPRYLPAAIMGSEALAWLDAAFQDGRVTQGSVLFHGPLHAFPFDGQEGRFEVDFGVEGAELFLRPNWPSLRQTDARVRFLNRGMVIDVASGRMYDSAIGPTRVAIDDLHQPLLSVRGMAQLNGDDALRLLRDTPLREHVGEYVSALRLEGQSALELAFDLPLQKALAASQPFRLDGTVTLQDNRLWLEERFAIEAISGRLAFSETGLQAEALQARLLDAPASITIYGEGAGNSARTVFAGRGTLTATGLRRLADTPLLDQVHGSAPWQATLTVPHGGGEEGAVLRVYSDLHGMELALPPPLARAAEDGSALELVHHFSGPRRGQLRLGYGEVLTARLALDDAGRVQRGALHFGAGKAVLPAAKELHISGRLRALDLGRWRRLLGSGGMGGTLPLRLEMEELHLLPASGEDIPAAPGGDLPPLQVQIQRFGYGDLQLGQLGFSLRSSRAAVQVNDLSVQGPALQLSGQARWQLRPRSYSEVKLHLASPDVGQMLQDLQVASVITRGTAQVDIELNWPGRLTELDLARLDGRLHVRIEDGKLDEVSPGAGRLLGLLSLQALPRRLILDFRDLFQKGLAFNSIEGDITLHAGDAHTSNMVMDSAAAVVRIEGRTGLVARDYDQRITVVPNLSGTAPVVGTLAFGPQVGAVMLLFQRLLHKNVDEAARTEYRITGSWDQPLVEKLELPPAAPVEGAS
ncbi:YhdP family protein [Sulfurivermis fontis]|uniref:YhdP family protein n=1 Tax=Sulfurivermis fontis TaxID=1972068 RepID=UPI000FD8FF35|nr:YhdP family protein [Sulfurivermis fontis]